jgi:predicted aspartyl protease
LIESLVDIGASMLVMATNVVRELGIIHLVLGHETYKTSSGTIIQTLGRITNVLITISKVVYQMIF